MENKDFNFVDFGEDGQMDRRRQLIKIMKESPIPENELLLNTGLFLVPQTLSRIMFLEHVYKQILDVQGVIIDFGTRWGQNMSLFSAFRGIFEPFNRVRKIVGFDTFSGFVDVHEKDSTAAMMKKGSYSVTPNYEKQLASIMAIQEQESPLSHIKKHEIVKGDASEAFKKYLERHPETIVAMAYFDFDLYEPTKECLLQLKGHLTKGSILCFDELNDEICPGETVALKEVLGLSQYAIKRFPYNSRVSYLVIE